MSLSAIHAFDEARYALKDPLRSEAEVILALRKLAAELGTTRPEQGTYRAIRSVIDKFERPEAFSRDQDAWELHGAKPRNFKKWKKRIHELVPSMPEVDIFKDEAFLEFCAYHTLDPSMDCWAGVSGLTKKEELENRQVEAANKDARTLLLSHATYYIACHQEKASYEGWVALLHPENVDARLLQPDCEHRCIWQAALAAPPPAKERSCTRSHHSFVERTIGSVMVVLISSVELLLFSVLVALKGAAAAMTQSRQESLARVQKGDQVSVLTAPVCAVAAVLELLLRAAVLLVALLEAIIFGALMGIGTFLHGLCALSCSAGSKAARRLFAIRRAVRRRMTSTRAEREHSVVDALAEPSASTVRRTGIASAALTDGSDRKNSKPGTSAAASSAASPSPEGQSDTEPSGPHPADDAMHVVVGMPVDAGRSIPMARSLEATPSFETAPAPSEPPAREKENDGSSLV
jgi:hypothetical protein